VVLLEEHEWQELAPLRKFSFLEIKDGSGECLMFEFLLFSLQQITANSTRGAATIPMKNSQMIIK